MNSAEIVGLGIVAVDDTIMVGAFPAPDTKQCFLSKRRTGGGQTATAFVAAARLGCSCLWCGELGDNELSEFSREVFRRDGIRFRPGIRFPDAEPIHSVIINDVRDGSRTIMWNMDKVVAPDTGPELMAAVDGCQCLFVDQILADAHVALARRAAARDTAIVSDIEVPDSAPVRELVELADHVIIPASVAAAAFGDAAPEKALPKALRLGRKQLVCMTDGANGSWYMAADAPEKVRHQPAFAVQPVVDTNGCGDVFHGAYAAALVRGFPPGERVRRASAAAALKALKRGGQEGAPTLRELEDFLTKN